MNYGYYSPNYPGYGYSQTPQQIPQPQQQSGIVWVQGETGAKGYLMTPNSTALLMDSESNKMYIKTTDNAGMPTMRVFEYTEVFGAQQAPMTNGTEYALKADLNAIKARVEEIAEQIKERASKASSKAKTEVEDGK